MKFAFLHRIRKLLLASIYIAALVVTVALFVQTLQRVSGFETTSLAVQTPPVPLATPTSAATAVPMVSFAMVAPPTPTPLAAEVPPQPVGYHPKTGRYIAVWMPPVYHSGAQASFEANKDIIDEISPFWYVTDGSGRIYGNRDDDLVRLAQSHNILVIPTIHNVGDPAAVVPVLTDPQRRARHIQNILDEVLARNYDGIDIDYESLSPSLRPQFTTFIRELAEVLHAHGKLLTIAVHAKDQDYGGLGGFQDWVEIGKYVDRLRIMTYDYHWRGSGPGPVAPLYWVESVAEYARSVVDPAKVVIGIHFYGYDWPPGGNARALPWKDIEDLITQQNLTVNLMQRNSQGRVDESWFNYQSRQGTRQVWFMTDNGLESKLELVQQLDLAGIAIWQLGYEKPEYWEVIRNSLVNDPALIQRAINPLLPEH